MLIAAFERTPFSRPRWVAGTAAAAVSGLLLAGAPQVQAALVEPTHPSIVSANPENFTPNVENGKVESMVQVGNRIIATGTFTSVTPVGGPTVTRNKIFAFNATTGALDNGFNVNVGTKEVAEVVDAGHGNLYIGGAFTAVNGTATPGRVAQISATTGALVTGFKAPKVNGNINDMHLVGGKLYVGGSFTTMGTQSRSLLAALNPASGLDTGAVAVTFSGLHNGGANTIKHFDVSNDGNTLVAVGNWTQVDGQSRDQIVMLDTSGANATVSGWATSRYEAQCAGVFDTYMRDVDIAPSGNYFVAVSTGAFNGGTLCDAAGRFAIGPNTGSQQPEWVDYSGGDTFTQVKIAGAAIYVGGHMRWVNNPFAGDAAGPGAVPREGLAALDPRNGLPFSWNPTRARGVGVWEFLPTDTGLWIGHDTNQLGKETRKRIAFMPLAGGTTIPADNTGSLPGDLYSLGQKASATSGHWVARVNGGGSTVLANDDGPDWVSDSGSFRQGGNEANWGDLPFTTDTTVPATTPKAIFSTERWGGSSWDFPAPSGANLEVRLYFANGCSCTEAVGSRVFDVNIEGGDVELDDFDIVQAAGDQNGTMRKFDVFNSDGNVDIDLTNVVENPLVNGIEIINKDVPAPAAGDNDAVVKRTVQPGGSAGSPSTIGTGGVAWSSDRGAVMIDGKLYTGWSDGTFKVRSFNGTTFGNSSDFSLYGLTAFSNDVSNMTGMFFDRATGRLYYTVAGQSQLYYRYFTPQSQVVGAERFNATGNAGGVDWSDASGMLLDAGNLYIASSSDGNLRSIGWDSASGTVTGNLSAPVSGPATGDGNDYRARGTFLLSN